MLTIQYEADSVLEIFLDEEGRDQLIYILSRLTIGDHDHLMTPAWGGYELTEEFPVKELTPIHKVTVSLTDELNDAPEEP